MHQLLTDSPTAFPVTRKLRSVMLGMHGSRLSALRVAAPHLASALPALQCLTLTLYCHEADISRSECHGPMSLCMCVCCSCATSKFQGPVGFPAGTAGGMSVGKGQL